MGKRSEFVRLERDRYPTPISAVYPLVPFLSDVKSYCEPCASGLMLISNIWIASGRQVSCVAALDIEPTKLDVGVVEKDALDLAESDLNGAEYIITNPPWDRKILHPMIDRFRTLRPTWLLFDADWCHTKQSAPYIKYCDKIVSVGRVKWFPDSKQTGKDNCAWHLFLPTECETKFYGRTA